MMINPNLTIVALVTEESKKKILAFYDESMIEKNNDVTRFKIEKCNINVFNKAHEDKFKVVFQGLNAQNEIKIWENENLEIQKPLLTRKIPFKNENKINYENKFPQIGSDEVGTGDFFGPIVVVATIVNKKDLALLQDLKITDSKKMKDEYILSIGPRLIKNFTYSQLSLDNEKYNKLSSEINILEMKVKMHNKAYLNLIDRNIHYQVIYQDQFTSEKSYYNYLKDEDRIVDNVVFSPRGELRFYSVALSSVIARYSFLRKMQLLSEKYKLEIPFGASSKVDDFSLLFLKKYGQKEFDKIVKKNFKNYQRIISNYLKEN